MTHPLSCLLTLRWPTVRAGEQINALNKLGNDFHRNVVVGSTALLTPTDFLSHVRDHTISVRSNVPSLCLSACLPACLPACLYVRHALSVFIFVAGTALCRTIFPASVDS